MSSLPRSWTQYYNKKKGDDQSRRLRSETGTGTTTQTSPGTATSPQGAKTPRTPTFGTPAFQNTDPEFQGGRSKYFLTEEQERGMSPEKKQQLEKDPSRVAGTEGWRDPVTPGMHRVDVVSNQKGLDRQQQRMDREDFRQELATTKQARDHSSRRMDMDEATHDFDMLRDLHDWKHGGDSELQGEVITAGMELGWSPQKIGQFLSGFPDGLGGGPTGSRFLNEAIGKFGPPEGDPDWRNIFDPILTSEELEEGKQSTRTPKEGPLTLEDIEGMKGVGLGDIVSREYPFPGQQKLEKGAKERGERYSQWMKERFPRLHKWLTGEMGKFTR